MLDWKRKEPEFMESVEAGISTPGLVEITLRIEDDEVVVVEAEEKGEQRSYRDRISTSDWTRKEPKFVERVKAGSSSPEVGLVRSYLDQLSRSSNRDRIARIDEPEKSSLESEWVICIKEKLNQARPPSSWAKLCIYRAPKSLRNADHKAYCPQIVSIGPYYHGKEWLADMEQHKWRALQQVLERNSQDVNLYLNSIKELEEEARRCYDDTIELSSNEFVEIMVLDGCFMLELFQGVAASFLDLGYSRNDPIFAKRGTMHSIRRDMIILENQLPLFVLDRLLQLQIGESEQRNLVAKLVLKFFDPLRPNGQRIWESEFDGDNLINRGLHCLDVFRQSILQGGLQFTPKLFLNSWSGVIGDTDKRKQQLIHCVTELREAGIRFTKRDTVRFWDIKFEAGILQIPLLLIHDGTRSLFLNLLAFEHCHLDCSNDVTSYVSFMDNLINSSDDVDYLHRRGIVEHGLGSHDEVRDLFNMLCREVVFDIHDSYLSKVSQKLSEEVNKYHNYRCDHWQLNLKHKYFSSPWSIISIVAATILLLLTSIQSFYAVYAYYHPRS